MEHYLTYKKLIELISQNLPIKIKSFNTGDLAYLGKENNPTLYPLMHVVPNQITYNENTTQFTLNILFCDIVNTDMSNEVSVISDMNLACRDFLSQIKLGVFYDYFDTDLPNTSTTFLERFNDHLGGVELNIPVTIFEDMNACDQYESIPSPSPSPSVTPSVTPSATPSVTITPTPSVTPGLSPSLTPTPSLTPSITPSITPSATPSVTPDLSPSLTPTPSITPSLTPSITPTPTSSSSNSIVVFERYRRVVSGSGNRTLNVVCVFPIADPCWMRFADPPPSTGGVTMPYVSRTITNISNCFGGSGIQDWSLTRAIYRNAGGSGTYRLSQITINLYENSPTNLVATRSVSYSPAWLITTSGLDDGTPPIISDQTLSVLPIYSPIPGNTYYLEWVDTVTRS